MIERITGHGLPLGLERGVLSRGFHFLFEGFPPGGGNFGFPPPENWDPGPLFFITYAFFFSWFRGSAGFAGWDRTEIFYD